MYIYIYNHHHVVLKAQISLTLSCYLFLSSLHSAGLLDYILCPYRAVVDNF